MPVSTVIIVYFLACLFAGYLGRNTRLGFLGTTVVSLLNPLVVVLVLLLVGTPPDARK